MANIEAGFVNAVKGIAKGNSEDLVNCKDARNVTLAGAAGGAVVGGFLGRMRTRAGKDPIAKVLF